MIRSFLQKFLKKPVSRLSDKYQSRPDKERVYESLTALYNNILENPGKRGPIMALNLNSKIVVLSDQHKGAKNGSDDFMFAERNYLAALSYYNQNNFCYINLGDSEELWENTFDAVKKSNQATFEAEKLFLQRNAFVKIFGNHDLYWDNDPLASLSLEGIYGQKVKIFEGAILQIPINGTLLNVFLTHGHQGDLQSDGNWFSKWFVSVIWARLQAYLKLNPNTPAFDDRLKTAHNRMMYEWSAAQKNLLLITGHTHQAVFASLTHLEHLYHRLEQARKENNSDSVQLLEQQIKARIHEGDPLPDFKGYNPSYFNSGCCCFDDGDITGIEIDSGKIRLVKWEYNSDKMPERIVLEEVELSRLIAASNALP